MDDAQKNIAWLGVFFLQVLLHRPIEGFFLSLKVGREAAARLGHRQAVIVFIKNVQLGQRHGFSFWIHDGEPGASATGGGKKRLVFLPSLTLPAPQTKPNRGCHSNRNSSFMV